jgi:hypothetical protein
MSKSIAVKKKVENAIAILNGEIQLPQGWKKREDSTVEYKDLASFFNFLIDADTAIRKLCAQSVDLSTHVNAL